MVLKIEPIDKALNEVRSGWSGKKTRTVLLSAQGRLFDQAARRDWQPTTRWL